MRGWGWILIRPSRDSDADPPQFWKAIDAYPPDHPREVKHKKVSERKLGSCKQLRIAPIIRACPKRFLSRCFSGSAFKVKG